MVDLSKMTKWDLGKCFDYSVLPKNSRQEDIIKGCQEAKKYNCAAFYAATNYWVPTMVRELEGTGILVTALFLLLSVDLFWLLKKKIAVKDQ